MMNYERLDFSVFSVWISSVASVLKVGVQHWKNQNAIGFETLNTQTSMINIHCVIRDLL